MKQLVLLSSFLLLWSTSADAGGARSCSSSFKKHRVFYGHNADRTSVLKEALANACEVGLSDSQIAGRVLKSCMKSCDAPAEKEYDVIESLLLDEEKKPSKPVASDGAQCKQSCFGTLQKMAKETQRLKNSKTARR